MDDARKNGQRNGWGGMIGLAARNETGNGIELAKTRVGNRQRDGRYGNAERATHEQTVNKTDGTELSGDGLTTRQENERLEWRK